MGALLSLVMLVLLLGVLGLAGAGLLGLLGALQRQGPADPQRPGPGEAQRLQDLERRVRALELTLSAIAPQLLRHPPEQPARAQTPAREQALSPASGQAQPPSSTAHPRPERPERPAGQPAPEQRPPAPARQTPRAAEIAAEPPAWLRRWRERWSENWTGILGTAAVVAGVTFVAINLALRLDPFQRFLLVSTTAAAMGVPSLLVGRRQRWRDLGDWLRSGGAALFLFACTAGGGLPQLGLRWLDAPEPALALLALGLAVNLALAAVSRTQTVAALHVVLALIPLTIAPQSWQTLLLASAVGLIGLQLPRRQPWFALRLTVVASYGLFHASWFLRQGADLAAQPALRDAAGLMGMAVFGVAVLLEHRPALVPTSLTPLPLAALPLVALLSGWCGLAAIPLAYPLAAGNRAAALAGCAGLALLLERRCRPCGALWLQRTNRLVAQGLAMAALLSLRPLLLRDAPQAPATLLALLLLVDCALFLGLGVRQGDGLIRRVGWVLTVLSGLALAGTGLDQALRWPAGSLDNSGLVLLGSLLLTAVAALLKRHRIPQPLPALLGWLAGLLVFIGAALAATAPLRPGLSLAAMGGLLLVGRRLRPAGLLSGVSGAVLAVHGRLWLQLLQGHTWQAGALLPLLLPLLGLALILVLAGRRGWWRPLGIHLLGLDLLLGSYLLLEPVSALMVGVVWLMLAVLSLELADRLRPAEARHVLLVAVLDLLAFAGSYLLVISQSPAYVQLGSLSVAGRLLIELFAIAVALYGWFFHGGRVLAELPLWRALQPCFLEASLLGVAVTLLIEVTTLWRPVGWSLLALVLLSPPLRRLFAARIQVYAVLMQWLAVATLLANLSSLPSPSQQWSEQPGPIALLAIVLQVGFLVASHRWLRDADLRDADGQGLLAWVGQRVADQPRRWLYYPECVAVALYLALHYDRSLLTLLWAVEAFVIYGLSAVLRDGQFRSVALVAMGACLVRLVSIDLAQADLGLRGLVFIGVGLLMLGMNTIYTRFWSGPR